GDVDAVAAKALAVLEEDRALGRSQDAEEVLGRERIERAANRETSDELGLEAEVDEVFRRHFREEPTRLELILSLSALEADAPIAEAARDDLRQPGERAADDEEDVPRVDRAARRAPLPHLEEILELRSDVERASQRDLGVLHELQKRHLHAAAARIASTGRVLRGRDLVDLVEEDDAVLGKERVSIRDAVELADHVLDIAADVSRLGELGAVRLDERNADHLGEDLDEVGFPDARRTQEDDVLFDIVRRARRVRIARL